MRYLDKACSWLIFLAGIIHIVLTEAFHPRGSVVDTGLLYIFVAMFNLLRIQNDGSVKLIRVFCMAANISVLMLEILRLNTFEWHPVPRVATIWSIGIVGLVLLQTAFSAKAKRPL